MTEVLSITQQESNAYFGAPLRRSSSQTSFLLHNAAPYSRSTSNLKQRYAAVGYDTSKLPTSLPSSAPSSPRLAAPGFSSQPSFTSTPSSSLSLDDQYGPVDEDIIFPTYDSPDCQPAAPVTQKSPIPQTTKSDVTHSASDTCLAKSACCDTSRVHRKACDDTAVQSEPTRQVDYLSYNWKEEDIWASWRHIVGHRDAYPNSVRLENASWRTWAKSIHRLKTVSPEILNWYGLYLEFGRCWKQANWGLIRNRMKDHDVTWLYGPLQLGRGRSLDAQPTPPTSQLSRSSSFTSRKPILRKRTRSEIMLQRSLSTSTLMKQATDALRAQQPGPVVDGRPTLGNRTYSDFAASLDFGVPLTRSTTHPSTNPSSSTSGLQTPCTKRHIHFNNKVEQCIAIDKDHVEQPHFLTAIQDDDDSSSEEEMLVMKPVRQSSKAKISSGRNTPRNSFSNDSKSIAMLPATTLNFRSDTPETGEPSTKPTDRTWKATPKLSHSSSQQTLRPSSPTHNFLLGDEEEDVDLNWQPSAAGGRRGSIYPRGGLRIDDEDEDDPERDGLRRTPSGMFMPFEEEEEDDEPASSGVLGRVIDTVNTAKDIAHVIWNVGWHR